MLLELTNAERNLLLSILAAHLGDLREEIYKTEATDYKVPLKEREALLLSLIDRLQRAS